MSHDMAAIAAHLRQAGYRVTPQRQLILDAVCRLGGHVTPEAVLAQVRAVAPAINVATVYRTLHFLAEQRLLTVVALPGGRRAYELAGSEPHHHLICRACGADTEFVPAGLQSLAEAVAHDYGFAMDVDHITFSGLCHACCEEG